MGNRQLTADELALANNVLDEVREKLNSLSVGDRELLFAYRRKIFKELMHDERSKPSVRRALKQRKWKEQHGLCPICHEALPDKYAVLDRTNAVDGYTVANTRLIHAACDTKNQASKGYT